MSSAQGASRAPLNLTFGVELECSLWRGNSLDDEHWDSWMDCVSQVLSKSCLREKIRPRSDFSRHEMKRVNHNCWVVASDGSVNRHDLEAQPMELRSRVLDFNQAGMDEARSVAETLGECFEITNDESTGMHVHIGNGIHGFPLRTLQNVSLLWVGFEHLWNSMHPDCRVVGRENKENYALPISRNKSFCDLEAGFARLLPILQTQNFEELLSLLQPSGRFASINMCPLLVESKENVSWPNSKSHKRTIEFRQHEGTIDPDAVLNWVEVVGSVVQYAHRVSEADLIEVLCRVKDARFTILDLLDEIGCGHLVVYYGSRLHLRGHSVEPFPEPDVVREATFVTQMLNREAKMEALEELWLKQGRQSLSGAHFLTPILMEGGLNNPWFPWNRVPFDCPWDLNMSHWSGLPLPNSWYVAHRICEAPFKLPESIARDERLRNEFEARRSRYLRYSLGHWEVGSDTTVEEEDDLYQTGVDGSIVW